MENNMYEIIDVKGKKYLYLSGSMDLIEYNEELGQILDRLDKTELEISGLTKYLDKDQLIYNSYIHFLSNQNSIKQGIAACEINVFHGCNLQCRYCFAGQGNHGKTGKMTGDTAKKMVKFIMNHSTKDTIDMTFIGGEPLLNVGAIEEAISTSKKIEESYSKKVYYSMVTNGTLLSVELSDLINKNNISTMLSLDSHDSCINDYLRPGSMGVSTYEMVWNKREYINDELNINVTVTPFNMNLSEIARTFYDRGVMSIHFGEVISDDSEMQFLREDIEVLKEEYSKVADIIIDRYRRGDKAECYPLTTFLDKIKMKKPMLGCCSVLKNHCAFSPDGKIYPCDMMMFDDYCIGDIEQGFDYDKIEGLNEILMEEGACETCWARFICGGECLSTKLWKNKEQRKLRCILKRHICSLKLYLFEQIKDFIK